MNRHNALDQAAINRRAITEEGIPLIALSPSYNQKGEVYSYEIGSPLYVSWSSISVQVLYSLFQCFREAFS